MAKTITMTLDEYNADIEAAKKAGEVSGKYAPLIELVREITAWEAFAGLPTFSSRIPVGRRIHNWSGEEIEAKLRNLMHEIDGY